MQAAKIKPDVITYTGLINAYSKARRVEEAQVVFREMVASGIRLAASVPFKFATIMPGKCVSLFTSLLGFPRA